MDYEALKTTYLKLLDAECNEHVYQDFLEEYPEFIPREFIQNHGVHLDLVLRKVAFGGEYVSDFVYLSKSSGDWNVVLVEIEKPQCGYFKNDEGDMHPAFSVGLQQINRWRAWLDVPENRAYFLNTTLGFLRVPIMLRENPCRIKYILVTGRKAEAQDNPKKRALITAQEQQDTFKILSFDSLLHLERIPSPRYVGALRGIGLDIVSSRYAGEKVFSWIEPDTIRITDVLRTDCITHKGEWHTRTLDDDGTISLADAGKMVLDDRLDKLGKTAPPQRKHLTEALVRLGLSLPK